MKVAIIGAGASGLASARRAIEYNVDIVVFEETDHVGGIWKYCENIASSLSPIYASLRYQRFHSLNTMNTRYVRTLNLFPIDM